MLFLPLKGRQSSPVIARRKERPDFYDLCTPSTYSRQLKNKRSLSRMQIEKKAVSYILNFFLLLIAILN